MTARIARRYLTWRRWPRCWAVFKLVFHFFTIRGRHGKTHAAHRDCSSTNEMGTSLAGMFSDVWLARQSIFQKIFFLRFMASAILSPAGYPTARSIRPRGSRVSRPPPLTQQISSGASARNATLRQHQPRRRACASRLKIAVTVLVGNTLRQPGLSPLGKTSPPTGHKPSSGKRESSIFLFMC